MRSGVTFHSLRNPTKNLPPTLLSFNERTPSLSHEPPLAATTTDHQPPPPYPQTHPSRHHHLSISLTLTRSTTTVGVSEPPTLSRQSAASHLVAVAAAPSWRRCTCEVRGRRLQSRSRLSRCQWLPSFSPSLSL
ncbi:hypothetical protein PIB30_014644 [Stylosanthes scabra]|uniref:Uncharacterized protein n=1 Tax=Stylosanthes scabra TaxID=79078 RepID=A0ABU6S6H7_9FABA|nr:hypothetical protein [Stylosanthes scabra]